MGAFDAKIVAPNESVAGKTQAEWGDKWWKYVYSLPVVPLDKPLSDNPILSDDVTDPGGERGSNAKAQFNQIGPVFYLNGSFAARPIATAEGEFIAERTITIPAGKYIWLPLRNTQLDTVQRPGKSVDEIRQEMEDNRLFDRDIFTSINGDVVVNEIFDPDSIEEPPPALTSPFRQVSPEAFEYKVPENNLLDTEGIGDIPAGTITNSVADGYWVMVEPLPVGNHTIVFGGTKDIDPTELPVDFKLTTTYNINVVPFNEIVADNHRNTLFGDAGNDNIDARGGNDVVFAGNGYNIVDGGKGSDSLYGGHDKDVIYGDSGNDRIYGNGGEDDLFGGEGNDRIYGASDDDLISGGDGNDKMYGNGGEDTLIGGEGDDLIYGGSQADILLGGGGNDIIYANGGGDVINSGIGEDTIWLGSGAATVVLEEGDGFDTVKNFVLGQTTFKVSSLNRDDFTFGNSAGGAQISQNGDLLAVVSWQSASTFENNFADIFVM